MSRNDLHFRLRIPEDLKKKVQKAAEENRRSMTAEIVARLETSFVVQTENTETVESLKQRLQAIANFIRQHEGEVRQIYEPPNKRQD